MKLAYVVATPDVRGTDATAYIGPTEPFFRELHRLGYDGVELMVRDPNEIDRRRDATLLWQNELEVALVNTGRVFLDDGLCLMLPPGDARAGASTHMRRDRLRSRDGRRDAADQRGSAARHVRRRARTRSQRARWVVENLRSWPEHAKHRGSPSPWNPSIAISPISSTRPARRSSWPRMRGRKHPGADGRLPHEYRGDVPVRKPDPVPRLDQPRARVRHQPAGARAGASRLQRDHRQPGRARLRGITFRRNWPAPDQTGAARLTAAHLKPLLNRRQRSQLLPNSEGAPCSRLHQPNENA